LPAHTEYKDNLRYTVQKLALIFGAGTLLVSQTLPDGDATYHGRHSRHAPPPSVPKNAQILPAFTVQCNGHSASRQFKKGLNVMCPKYWRSPVRSRVKCCI